MPTRSHPPVVYGLIDRRKPEDIVYVGRTRNLAHRLSKHMGSSGFTGRRVRAWADDIGRTNVEAVVLRKCSDVPESQAVEREYIGRLRPRLNVMPGGGGRT